jgi:hypothetical protein
MKKRWYSPWIIHHCFYPNGQGLWVPAGFEFVYPVAALPKRKPDPFHDKVMDFAALMEGGLAQGFASTIRLYKSDKVLIREKQSL